MENLMEKAHDLAMDIACKPPSCSCSGCHPVIIDGKLVHEPGCSWLNAPVGGGLGIIDTGVTKKKKEEPEPPEGYGELKVGMEGKLNGVPVVIRKITRKDIILRPLNRSIKDKHGLMVSFEEEKLNGS